MILEVVQFFLVGEMAVDQQKRGFNEVAVFRQLFDRYAPIQQDAFLSIQKRDLALAATGTDETGIIGDQSGRGLQAGDVYRLFPTGSLYDG